MAKSRRLTMPDLGEDVEQQELSPVASGNTKCDSHFGSRLVVSHRTHALAIKSANCSPWNYLKELKTYPHKNLHIDVYSNFTNYCENLEATIIFFSKWTDKTVVHPDDEILAPEENEIASHEKTWRNLKCMLLNERNQSEEVTYFLIPATWIKTVKIN